MFKHLTYFDAKGLDVSKLANLKFAPCESLEMQSVGFVPPYGEGDGLVRTLNGRDEFFALCVENKNVPKQVIDRNVREVSATVEKQQGFKPGRKQTREIREQVLDSLLPRAFSSRKVTRCWYDPKLGRLVVDSVSNGAIDQVIRALYKVHNETKGFDLASVRTAVSPVAAMTQWLLNDETPSGFTVDDMVHLQRPTESKAAARFVNHVLDSTLILPHLQDGKTCRKLAMTWADRISFVLHDHAGLSGIEPLDVIKQEADQMYNDDQERLDSDLTLMAGEFRKLIEDLEYALGGRFVEENE